MARSSKKSEEPLFYGLAEKMDREQRAFFDAMLTSRAVFCNAPAGSGKTTLAVAAAKYLTERGDVNGLVYIFSPVEETVMGYRPGTQEEKEFAYTFPLRDALVEIGDIPEKAMDDKTGWVKARSHTFMRGTNISNKFVIVEEAQNFTVSELRKVYSRIHDDCRIVSIGHSGQIDIKKTQSGFVKYIEHFKDQPYVQVCSLSKNYRGEFANHADKLEG